MEICISRAPVIRDRACTPHPAFLYHLSSLQKYHICAERTYVQFFRHHVLKKTKQNRVISVDSKYGMMTWLFLMSSERQCWSCLNKVYLKIQNLLCSMFMLQDCHWMGKSPQLPTIPPGQDGGHSLYGHDTQSGLPVPLLSPRRLWTSCHHHRCQVGDGFSHLIFLFFSLQTLLNIPNKRGIFNKWSSGPTVVL